MNCIKCSLKQTIPSKERWELYGTFDFDEHGKGKHLDCKHNWEYNWDQTYRWCKKCKKNE